jgi:hypothetical protein
VTATELLNSAPAWGAYIIVGGRVAVEGSIRRVERNAHARSVAARRAQHRAESVEAARQRGIEAAQARQSTGWHHNRREVRQ